MESPSLEVFQDRLGMALSVSFLVDKVVIGHRLDSMIPEVFFNLIDSVIL